MMFMSLHLIMMKLLAGINLHVVILEILRKFDMHDEQYASHYLTLENTHQKMHHHPSATQVFACAGPMGVILPLSVRELRLTFVNSLW